jgi:hypothetical protein
MLLLGSEDPALPPFIPLSLKSLTLSWEHIDVQPLMLPGRLSSMIKSSGAKLHTLELYLAKLGDEITARGVRSLLQTCAPTLTHVDLDIESPVLASMEVVAEGLARCEHLTGLTTPMSTFATPLGNISAGLLVLRLNNKPGGRQDCSDFALWGLMARGDLPLLSWLSLDCDGWRWGPDVRTAMVAAFEGVAGTLKKLWFNQTDFCVSVDGVGADSAVRQLGEAIGKLRRLEALNLNVGKQGRQYHRIAQGMGNGACPALRSLTIDIDSGAAWMSCQPSIIRPTLQNLQVFFGTAAGSEPLFTASALMSLGFRGSVTMWRVPKEGGQRDEIRELLKLPPWRVQFR